jgi:hypothetical protein
MTYIVGVVCFTRWRRASRVWRRDLMVFGAYLLHIKYEL